MDTLLRKLCTGIRYRYLSTYSEHGLPVRYRYQVGRNTFWKSSFLWFLWVIIYSNLSKLHHLPLERRSCAATLCGPILWHADVLQVPRHSASRWGPRPTQDWRTGSLLRTATQANQGRTLYRQLFVYIPVYCTVVQLKGNWTAVFVKKSTFWTSDGYSLRNVPVPY
jgi:hypothetical protein